jgi:hypothetical protein
MAQYIVTITPVLGSGGNEDEGSRTTMRVVAEDGHAYIKELTVRVAENARLGPSEVIQVDLDILLQAFASRQPEIAVRSQAAPVAAGSARSMPSMSARAKPDRAYRRMPVPSEVKASYLASRTITGVAEHYGVPTHTAQGWVSRLRRKGIIPAGK